MPACEPAAIPERSVAMTKQDGVIPMSALKRWLVYAAVSGLAAGAFVTWKFLTAGG